MSLFRETSTEDLWIIAAEDPGVAVFQELLTRLTRPEGFDSGFGDKLEFLLDNLTAGADVEGEKSLDAAQAGFLVDLAALGAPDSSSFRRALGTAIKQQLPPYQAKNPALLRGLGVRDSQVPLPLVAKRFAALQHLKDGAMVYLAGAARWGTVSSQVSPAGSVAITPLPEGGMLAIPLPGVLDNALFFTPGTEVLKLADSRSKPSVSANDYRQIARRHTVQTLADEELRDIAKSTLVPRAFTTEEFDKWWQAATATGRHGVGRRSCDGRSLKEMALLLEAEVAAGDSRLDDDEAQHFAAFFANLKDTVALREPKLLAEVIAMTAQRAKPEQMALIFDELVDKAPFWPSDLGLANPAELNAWGEVAAKFLPGLGAATRSVFDDAFLAAYAVRLPLRALTPLCEGLDKEILYDIFGTVRFAGGDFMLWLWKNRKTTPEEVLALVNIENVVRALNQESLPKAWSAGQRDLRKQLIDKADFQQQMIDAAGGVASAVISSLAGANFFAAGERQSLLAKFARLSPAIKEYLENGAGEQMLASAKEHQGQASSQFLEPPYTSMASYRRRRQELDDIINIHQPENRESLKTARAHGDFRENAEFDAAKERRNYLSRRRHELESDLLRIQTVAFDNIEIADIAVIGCTVELAFTDGSRETYHLVGAWDGDPERNLLSYKARLGDAIYRKKTGSEFEIPGGRKCSLAAIRPLPPEIVEEMK